MVKRKVSALLCLLLMIQTDLAVAASTPKCFYNDVVVNREKPYDDCQNQPEFYQKKYQDCIVAHDQSAFESKLLRREQLKKILSLEIAYAARITPNSSVYEAEWAKVKTLFAGIPIMEPDVLDLDENNHFDRDRCSLHFLLGIDCKGETALDTINIEKDAAAEEAIKRASQRKLPMSLTYDLVHAVLMLESAKNSFTDTFRNDEFKKRKEIERLKISNYFFKFYPELALDANIYAQIFNLITRIGLNQEVFDRVHKIEIKRPITMDDRQEVVVHFMETTFQKNPVPSEVMSHIEEDFFKAHSQIQTTLDYNLMRGKSDKAWLFDQDYLLISGLRSSAVWRGTQQGPYFQTYLCHNQIDYQKKEERKRAFETWGGLAALLTGVGAMFDLGAIVGTTCVVSSFGLLDAISAVDIYSSVKDVGNQKNLFALRTNYYSDLLSAQEDLDSAIPWAILSLAMMSPIVAMKYINSARTAAIAAGDYQKVMNLNRYRKMTVLSGAAMGVAITGYNVKEAAPVAYDLYQEKMKEWNSKTGNVSPTVDPSKK